jgi:hypothetical protein
MESTKTRTERKPSHRNHEVPPPYSVDAEKGVLSSILQSPREAMPECVEKIKEEFFYVPEHHTIYIALLDMWDAGEAIDLITFAQALRDRNVLERVGGAGFVTELQTLVPTAANLQYYLDIVLEKHVRRQIIRAGTESVRRAYDEQDGANGELLDELQSRLASIRSLDRDALPTGISIIDYAEMDPETFAADNLLGDRYLCIEGSLLFVGPSEAGKSSAGAQMHILWGCGREAFGIRPVRPLKILCVNAENDDGDISEMARGVCDHLGLSDEERELMRRNVLYKKHNETNGAEFLRWLRKLVRKFRSDIVCIDPLHAYAGGDVRDSKVTTPFLRNGLNPILSEFRCAAIINHHPPKPIYRDTSDWTPSDWMYSGAGNADITNWARAILVMEATHEQDVLKFRAAKRGRRIGWADENGHRVYERTFCKHSGDAIFWRDSTDEDLERVAQAKPGKKSKQAKTPEDVYNLIPKTGCISRPSLKAAFAAADIGQNRGFDFLNVLIEQKRVFVWKMKRPGVRPALAYSVHPQELIE